jgi:hypothetical protein
MAFPTCPTMNTKSLVPHIRGSLYPHETKLKTSFVNLEERKVNYMKGFEQAWKVSTIMKVNCMNEK